MCKNLWTEFPHKMTKVRHSLIFPDFPWKHLFHLIQMSCKLGWKDIPDLKVQVRQLVKGRVHLAMRNVQWKRWVWKKPREPLHWGTQAGTPRSGLDMRRGRCVQTSNVHSYCVAAKCTVHHTWNKNQKPGSTGEHMKNMCLTHKRIRAYQSLAGPRTTFLVWNPVLKRNLAASCILIIAISSASGKRWSWPKSHKIEILMDKGAKTSNKKKKLNPTLHCIQVEAQIRFRKRILGVFITLYTSEKCILMEKKTLFLYVKGPDRRAHVSFIPSSTSVLHSSKQKHILCEFISDNFCRACTRSVHEELNFLSVIIARKTKIQF